LLREADADAGFAFQVTKWCEQMAGALRGQFGQALYYRGAVQWIAELVGRGFAVSAEPMSEGTPFANVLFVARKSPRIQDETADKSRSNDFCQLPIIMG